MRIPENHTITPPTLECYLEARNGFTGDVATDLAVMLIDYVRESRQIDQQQTRAEQAQLRLEQAAQVKAMREEADAIREAGMIQGTSKMLGGGLGIASGIVAVSTTSTGDKSTASTGDKSAPSTTPQGAPSQQAAIDWPTALQGSAKAVDGGSELWTANVDRSAALARTRATEHDHRAGESERRLDTLDEARSHAKELEQSAFEHLQNVQGTRADTERARVTWRA
jgi:hypothetical protein